MIRAAVNMAEVRELARARRFRLCIPQSSVVMTRSGLPEIRLSWIFLVAMAAATTQAEWKSYCDGEDEVRCGEA